VSLEIAQNIHREELNTSENVEEKKKDEEKIDVFFFGSLFE